MNFKLKTAEVIVSIFLFIASCALPAVVLAGTMPGPSSGGNPALQDLDNVATNFGPYEKPQGTSQDLLLKIIGTVVSIVLGLLGVLFLGLMLFAGYNWMTAQGEEEKVTKAKNIITQAIIGLIIVVGAYASWYYLFSRLF